MQNKKGYSTAFPDKDKFPLLDRSWCLHTTRVTSYDSSPRWRAFSQGIYIQSIEPQTVLSAGYPPRQIKNLLIIGKVKPSEREFRLKY